MLALLSHHLGRQGCLALLGWASVLPLPLLVELFLCVEGQQEDMYSSSIRQCWLLLQAGAVGERQRQRRMQQQRAGARSFPTCLRSH